MKLPIYAIVISLFLSVSLFAFLTSVLFFGLGFFFLLYILKMSLPEKGGKNKKRQEKKPFSLL